MALFNSPSEVVGLAVEVEKAGREFYERSAAAATSAPVKDLFTFLAGEESRHERTYRELFNKIKDSPSELPYDWEDAQQYLKVITGSKFFLTPERAQALAGTARSETEALEFALQFEKETLLYYVELERLIAAAHRAVTAELIRQERIHIRRLAEMLTTTGGAH